MGKKTKVVEEVGIEEVASSPKPKKECSPELLERLAQMRLKASQSRKEKAKLNAKSKVNKIIKMEQLKKDAEEFDKTVEKLVVKPQLKQMVEPLALPQPVPQIMPEPVIVPAIPAQPLPPPTAPIQKSKKKKIIIEESSDDDDSEEEVIVRRVKREPRYPRTSSENEEFGRLTRNAINEKLREKINRERLNYVSDLLRPSYF